MKGADFTGFLGDFVGVWGGMGQPESQSIQQKIVWQDTKRFCFFREILFFQAAFGLCKGWGEQRGQRVAHPTVFRLKSLQNL